MTVTATARMELLLLPVPQSAGIARDFVKHHLISLGYPELVDDGCVVVSELVTNALRAVPGGEVMVWLGPNNGRPRLEVWDGSQTLPRKPHSDPLALDGRGLEIVDALVTAKGVYMLDIGPTRGKVVWVLLK